MSLGLANQYMVHMESPGFSREEEVKLPIIIMDKYHDMFVRASNPETHEKDGSGSPFGDDNTTVIM